MLLACPLSLVSMVVVLFSERLDGWFGTAADLFTDGCHFGAFLVAADIALRLPALFRRRQ